MSRSAAQSCASGCLRRRREGFTLVEVLASIVLVAIILPAAMKGISIATGLAGQAAHRMEAATLAESKLAEFVATEAWRDGDASGDFGDDWPQYTWSAELNDWEDGSATQVDLTVEWQSRGRDRSLTLSTLAYTGEA